MASTTYIPVNKPRVRPMEEIETGIVELKKVAKPNAVFCPSNSKCECSNSPECEFSTLNKGLRNASNLDMRKCLSRIDDEIKAATENLEKAIKSSKRKLELDYLAPEPEKLFPQMTAIELKQI